MSLIQAGKMEIVLGEYAVGTTAALIDPMLVSWAQDYRRHVASRLIPLDAEDIPKRFTSGLYTVSRKVDGEFNLLVFGSGQVLLVNPGGTVRMGLPLLKEAGKILEKAGITNAVIAGELHVRRAERRERVHDVSRIARQPASIAELEQLGFAAFDFIDLDGRKPGDRYGETLATLSEVLKGGKFCGVVESVALTDAASIEGQFRKWVETGAEGAVVRSDAVGQYKVKPRHTLDAVVIGFTEGQDDRKGLLHDVLIAMMRPDGCLHIVGHVGGGFTTEERREWLSDLKDMIVESDYAEVNDQVAYHMVSPQWVIEISVLDLISLSTRNMPIRKMVLDWQPVENRYRSVRRLPSVAMISPQYIRCREDKRVNLQDIRMQQVTELVEVPQSDRDARLLNLSASQLLKREVYTKEMKGQTMVRKLVMWQTNKSAESDEFPAFVIHYTDFSPNRKTPLERDLRVSSSCTQIDELWNELILENVSKGWALVKADRAGSAATAVAEELVTAPKPRAAKAAKSETEPKAPVKKPAASRKKKAD